ncbi:uncharacterized protein LOC131329706 isoform X2 [Rhododendron vialii]|uniref:uncharacterized protein LOC131329706 isoform X2 n=1 Tax=Rhododendron vialii TaxID=182163 RepID=UPI00265E1FF8|nr:uncharacterized protein LOC131329706 isoform X2 [Rhododendron vialii]
MPKVGFVDDDRDKDKRSDDDHNKDEGSDDDHNKDERSDDDHYEDEGSDDDNGLRFEDELLEIARLDDRHGLIKLMEGSYRSSESVFGYLSSKGAVNCVTALLEGEVGPPMELSVDPKFGKCPLHVATNKMSYSMVDLLLRYGARTDLKSKAMAITRGGLLPLNVALEKLSYHESLGGWTPKDPVFKLIILLCLPKMRVPLEVSRLLACNTKRVDDVFYYYAMEGKLIEMAALLMVAREKVMAAFEGSMHLRQFISEETASMHVDETKLTGCGKRGKWASVFKDKRLVMTSALELLEVFERAGDCIEAYAQSVRSEMTEQEVIKDITFLLEENGFNLKGLDIDLSNIDCALGIAHEKFKLEMQGLEKRRDFLGQVKDVGMLVPAQSGNFYAEKNPVPNKMNETALAPMRLYRPGSPLMPARIRVTSYPYCSGMAFSFLPKKTTTRKSLTDFLSAKTYGRFALLIKRGIKGI